MPIFVNCTCGKRLQGREADAGRQTRCPFCGNVLTLPGGEPERQPDRHGDPWPPPAPGPGPEPAPERDSAPVQWHTCRVCQASFTTREVYADGDTVICKRCHEREEARRGHAPQQERGEEPRRDRWGEEMPARPRRRRRYDDDDDDYHVRRPRGQHVPNYLTESILLLVFSVICCGVLTLPFAIPAVVYASQVNGRLDSGDYSGAVAASDSAKTWCGVTFAMLIVGGLLIVLYFVLAAR